MTERTFDFELKKDNKIFLFEGDIFYGVKFVRKPSGDMELSEIILYRWPQSESFWQNVNSALESLLIDNPERYIELMNFSKDKKLNDCCKEIYETKHEEVSKYLKDIIESTTLKLKTLENITF